MKGQISILCPACLVLSVMLALVGCASTDYGCKGMPNEPACMSAVDAYKATDKSNTTIRSSKGEHAKGEESSVSVSNAEPTRLVPAPKIDDPTPIRTPSKVMRVWIAPWEDSDGDLNLSGYVYTEIEPRRWMVDKAPTQPQALTQFQVKHREKTAQNNGKMNNGENYSKSGSAALGRNALGGNPNPSPLLLMQSPQE